MVSISGIQAAIFDPVISSFQQALNKRGIIIAIAVAAIVLVGAAVAFIIWRQLHAKKLSPEPLVTYSPPPPVDLAFPAKPSLVADLLKSVLPIPAATPVPSLPVTPPIPVTWGEPKGPVKLTTTGAAPSATATDAAVAGYHLTKEEEEKIKNFFHSDAPLEGFYLNGELDGDHQEEMVRVESIKMDMKFNPVDSVKFIKENYPQYDAVIQKNAPSYPGKAPLAYVCLHKALVYRELYRHTHYVFLHNRTFEWKIYTCLIKELVSLLKPEYSYKLYKFLRTPLSMHHFKNADAFLAHYGSALLGNSSADHAPHVRQQLISADALWLSDQAGESALNFFFRNDSVISYKNRDIVIEACKLLIDACLDELVQDREVILEEYGERIKNVVINLKQDLKKELPGELLVICIPKSIVKNPATNPIYRSHQYGKQCDCFGKHLDTDFIEQLQNDKVPSSSTCDQVQYRLLASHLLPKNGVRIFGFTNLESDVKNVYYRDPLKEIAQEIIALSQSTQEAWNMTAK